MKPTSLTVCVALSRGASGLNETLSSLGDRWSACVAIGPSPPEPGPEDLGERSLTYIPEISPIRSRIFRLALEQVSSPWTLLLDAGEVISGALARELDEVMSHGSVSAGSIRVEEPILEIHQ